MIQKVIKGKIEILEIVLFLLIVFFGAIYIHYSWARIENEQSEHVLQIARSIEATMPKEDLKTLEAKSGDIDKPQYTIVKNMLKKIIWVNKQARFAYIYVEQNGKLYFIADSEPEDSKDYSPPGQEYTEADVAYYKPFKNGKEGVTAPVTDRWGTWRSVVIPIKDDATGKTIAVFAMDFNAKTWANFLLFSITEASVLILLLMILLLISIRIKATNRSLKNEIAEHKLAVEALHESEEKYRLIFEYSPMGVLSFDENGVIITCNDNFAQIIGSSRKILTGLNMLNLPDKKIVSCIQKALNGSTGLYEDFYHSVTAEKITPVRALFAPMGAGDGPIHSGMGIIEDITERKMSEMALLQSQNRARLQRNAIARIVENEVISFGDLSSSFQKLTKEVADAIEVERTSVWLFSDDKTVLQCISLFENQTKTHSSGVILEYADYPRYFEAINQESRIYAGDAQNDPRTSEFTEGYLAPVGITSMLDAGVFVEGELKGVICFEHIGKMRTWYSDEESFASTIASIVAQKLANTKRKLTEEELEESREKYRGLSEASFESIFISEKGLCIDQNQTAEKTFGYTFKEAIGRYGTEWIVPEDREMVMKNMLTGYEEPYEATALKKDGSTFPCILRGKMMHYKGKNVRVTSLSDNTQHKRAVEEIHKLNEELDMRVKQRTAELEKANHELETFSYSISHDLRAPLRRLKAFVELFIDSKSSLITKEEQEYLDFIINSTTEMEKLIEAILSFSKLNRNELQKTIIHSSQMVQEVIKFFGMEMQNRKIKFNMDLLPAVFGDEDLLRQVWTNLISNAIKYTSKKYEAIIDIGSIVTDNETTFFVKDNGVGFNMKDVENLFGVFKRLHKSTDFEGVGIGLANVNRIITRHGGRCSAESEPEKGATFYFSLPN